MRRLVTHLGKYKSLAQGVLITVSLLAIIVIIGIMTGVIGVHTVVRVETMQGSEGTYYEFQKELWFDTVAKEVYIGSRAISTVHTALCVTAQDTFKLFEVQKPFRNLPKNFTYFQKNWIGIVQPGTSVCFSGYYVPDGYLLKGVNRGP